MQDKSATTKPRSRRRTWSYSAGEKGVNRVRVFERGAKGLYLEWFESGPQPTSPRKRVRMALGAIDREEAKAKADEVAARFRQAEAAKPTELTLKELFDMYEREITPTKGASKREHDARCLEMFLRFFGGNRKPQTLSRRDWDRFIAARRAGLITARGVPAGEGERWKVGERVVAYDLKQLLAVLNWATKAGDGQGGVLLDRNPLKGLSLPREESPSRPTLTSEQYATLLENAPEVGPGFELLVVLAHETGHRVGAIRTLRWSDVDLEAKRIRWRKQNDKIGFEHVTPLTDQAVALLARERARQAAIGAAPVFPSPRNPSAPASRFLVRDWWERGAALAELPAGHRVGYHSLRRKFATEMKHTPLRDLCELGGWKSPQTLLTCYQQPDEATQRAALATRRKLTAAGVSGAN